MNEHFLTALSPLDGRYASICDPLRSLLSEYALLKYRLIVEIKWLIHLSNEKSITEIPAIEVADQTYLRQLIDEFTLTEAEKIKTIEQTTKHDVKAVEYYLKEKLMARASLAPWCEGVHFACTSEDINNLAYALMLKETCASVIRPALNALIKQLTTMAHDYADAAMLSRTHGQAASPTTMGKELANFVARLKRQMHTLEHFKITGKINGAVGNFNAHSIAYPQVNWPSVSLEFVESLSLEYQAYTTQIEPHDNLAELMHLISRINTLLIDCSRDLWGYISLGYFSQQLIAGEVGSSTMPHKINPIDFENAEGNLGLANALALYLAEKLPISRWQRDLSDSTTLRNLSLVFGHSYLAYQALIKGLSKLKLNTTRLNEDLDQNWEILSEAVQTVMRRFGISEPYEKLKALTRGKKLEMSSLHAFIDAQPLPQEVKDELKKLTPHTYIGYAAELAQRC